MEIYTSIVDNSYIGMVGRPKHRPQKFKSSQTELKHTYQNFCKHVGKHRFHKWSAASTQPSLLIHSLVIHPHSRSQAFHGASRSSESRRDCLETTLSFATSGASVWLRKLCAKREELWGKILNLSTPVEINNIFLCIHQYLREFILQSWKSQVFLR